MLDGGNSNSCFIFTPNPVEMMQFDEDFFKGVGEKPPTRMGMECHVFLFPCGLLQESLGSTGTEVPRGAGGKSLSEPMKLVAWIHAGRVGDDNVEGFIKLQQLLLGGSSHLVSI